MGSSQKHYPAGLVVKNSDVEKREVLNFEPFLFYRKIISITACICFWGKKKKKPQQPELIYLNSNKNTNTF